MIRNTLLHDLDAIMNIIDEGKAFFKDKKINQWQRGYPSKELIENDIKNGRGFVFTNESDTKSESVAGYFCLDFDLCPDYAEIEGAFHSNEPYAAIHRIILTNNLRGKGFGGQMVDFAAKKCLERNVFWLRADTSEKNLSMQKMLSKKGFLPCGIIYVDGIREEYYKRIAFDLDLKGLSV